MLCNGIAKKNGINAFEWKIKAMRAISPKIHCQWTRRKTWNGMHTHNGQIIYVALLICLYFIHSFVFFYFAAPRWLCIAACMRLFWFCCDTHAIFLKPSSFGFAFIFILGQLEK